MRNKTKKLTIIFFTIFMLFSNFVFANPVKKGIVSPNKNKKLIIVNKTKGKYKPRVKPASQRIKKVKEQIEREKNKK